MNRFKQILVILVLAGSLVFAGYAAGGAQQGGQYQNPYDSTITVVPTGSAALLTANNTVVKQIFCANTTASAATVTITDNQGSPVTYAAAVSIAANSSTSLLSSTRGILMKGIKWGQGTGSACNCQISGEQ